MNKIELKENEITVSKNEEKILHLFDYEDQNKIYNFPTTLYHCYSENSISVIRM